MDRSFLGANALTGRMLTDRSVIVKAANLKDLELGGSAAHGVGRMTDLLGDLYDGRSSSQRAEDGFLVRLSQGYFLVLYG